MKYLGSTSLQEFIERDSGEKTNLKSNTLRILVALCQEGIQNSGVFGVVDDPDGLRRTLRQTSPFEELLEHEPELLNPILTLAKQGPPDWDVKVGLPITAEYRAALTPLFRMRLIHLIGCFSPRPAPDSVIDLLCATIASDGPGNFAAEQILERMGTVRAIGHLRARVRKLQFLRLFGDRVMRTSTIDRTTQLIAHIERGTRQS